MDKKNWQLIERRLVPNGNYAYATSANFYYKNMTRSKVEEIAANRLSYNSNIVSVFIREILNENKEDEEPLSE